MFRFEVSLILWLLCLLPLALLWFYFYSNFKRKKLNDAGDAPIIDRLLKDFSTKKQWLKSVLVLLALAFGILAWSNPQWGSRKQTLKVKSSDIVIALDISQSMMAEDISPNRMERAKFFLSELLQKFRGERVGLIFFAGSAYLQMPLSDDFASAETFIKSANPTQAGTQGTVIADAIKLSETIFGEENQTQKALIILSDGENHESEAIEAAKEAKEKLITSYTVGIGTLEGAYIPVTVNGKRVLKADENGNVVKTSLNEQNLIDIANAGGGKYFRIDSRMSAIDAIDQEIDQLEKKEIEQRSFTDYNSYFQYFLICCILFLVIEFFVTNKKGNNNRLKNILDF